MHIPLVDNMSFTSWFASGRSTWRFPNMKGTFSGVPRIRALLFLVSILGQCGPLVCIGLPWLSRSCMRHAQLAMERQQRRLQATWKCQRHSRRFCYLTQVLEPIWHGLEFLALQRSGSFCFTKSCMSLIAVYYHDSTVVSNKGSCRIL